VALLAAVWVSGIAVLNTGEADRPFGGETVTFCIADV
jgi:hypothetical protein